MGGGGTLIVLGVILVVAGVAGFLLAHLMRRDVHAMIAAETLPVAELRMYHQTALEVSGPGGFRRVCEVVGLAQPGPSGPLISEISKTPCVWHRHEIKRRYRHVHYDSNNRRQVSERTETVAKHTSAAPIAVTDQTGTVLVQASGLRSDAMEQVVNTFEPHQPQLTGPTIFGIQLGGWNRDDTIGYEYTEWVLRPGVRLYVHGEASDSSGQLVFGKPAGGPFIVSTKTEDELRAQSSTRQKVFAFGGLGAGVLGLVLLVVGIVIHR